MISKLVSLDHGALLIQLVRPMPQHPWTLLFLHQELKISPRKTLYKKPTVKVSKFIAELHNLAYTQETKVKRRAL